MTLTDHLVEIATASETYRSPDFTASGVPTRRAFAALKPGHPLFDAVTALSGDSPRSSRAPSANPQWDRLPEGMRGAWEDLVRLSNSWIPLGAEEQRFSELRKLCTVFEAAVIRFGLEGHHITEPACVGDGGSIVLADAQVGSPAADALDLLALIPPDSIVSVHHHAVIVVDSLRRLGAGAAASDRKDAVRQLLSAVHLAESWATQFLPAFRCKDAAAAVVGPYVFVGGMPFPSYHAAAFHHGLEVSAAVLSEAPVGRPSGIPTIRYRRAADRIGPAVVLRALKQAGLVNVSWDDYLNGLNVELRAAIGPLLSRLSEDPFASLLKALPDLCPSPLEQKVLSHLMSAGGTMRRGDLLEKAWGNKHAELKYVLRDLKKKLNVKKVSWKVRQTRGYVVLEPSDESGENAT